MGSRAACDDRGAPIRLPTMGAIRKALGRQVQPHTPEGGGTTVTGSMIGLSLLSGLKMGLIFVSVVLILTVFLQSMRPLFVMGIASLPVLILMYREWGRGYMTRAQAEPIIAALLSEGYCAQCLYPLADASVASDGCRVCNECGSAWNVDGEREAAEAN